MNAIQQEHRRSLVREFLLRNPDTRRADVVKHFIMQRMNRTTIYRYIKKIEKEEETKSKYKPGKKPCILTERIKNKLSKIFDGKIGASIRHASRTLNYSRRTIKRWLTELGIKKKARQVVPKSTEKQRVILHTISREEFRASNDDVEVIMDDETYFPLSGNNFQGNYYYDSGL